MIDNQSKNEEYKVKTKTLKYFDLFPLLKKLEGLRPGIKDRVWDFMCDEKEKDVAFRPYKGRISNINLFYYGAGDEYPLKYHKKYPDELEHCKRTHPHAFIPGSKEETLRLDFNLIWYIYEDEAEDIEMFPVIVQW